MSKQHLFSSWTTSGPTRRRPRLPDSCEEFTRLARDQAGSNCITLPQLKSYIFQGNTYIYIYIFICIYIYIYIHMYMCTYMYIYIYIYTCIYTHTYRSAPPCPPAAYGRALGEAYTYICNIYIYTHVYMYTCMHTLLCIHIHIILLVLLLLIL